MEHHSFSAVKKTAGDAHRAMLQLAGSNTWLVGFRARRFSNGVQELSRAIRDAHDAHAPRPSDGDLHRLGEVIDRIVLGIEEFLSRASERGVDKLARNQKLVGGIYELRRNFERVARGDRSRQLPELQ